MRRKSLSLTSVFGIIIMLKDTDDGFVGDEEVWGEPLERCMHCFKDFPLSKIIEHSRKCKGDMLGSRERFKNFLPSVHDVSWFVYLLAHHTFACISSLLYCNYIQYLSLKVLATMLWFVAFLYTLLTVQY